MRRYHYRQILELLSTIKEAQLARLYADCQDGAFYVGEFIEGLKGDGTRTVELLEEYCDLLFKASEGKAVEKALMRQMTQIENSVKHELKPDRTEIAFLSYKASMSDSLETIYFAAKADPNCEAYWMPVPYLERNADGTLGEMCCEGAAFYDANIDCVDWQEYDIEARRPDVVFTFSPYDAGNHVTSVHPDFYCARLRGLTDMLVYVPYFVSADDVEEHFCTVAGCVYAHKVIVQSEKIRDTYISVFREHFGNSFGRPQDKFIALGSPKFDKAINAERGNFTLPDKWREKIGDRKVVLFNTTLNAILFGNEQYLKKLRYVLDVFRSRDDVVLWWRPHPLSEATYQSMRPLLLGEYKQITADYLCGGFGIYDETPDFHRAIAYSDAYFGDRSSLAALHGTTGKPVMISDSNVIQSEVEFSPACVYIHNDTIWMTVRRVNALCKMSRTEWEPEFAGSFPEEMEFIPRYDYPLFLRPVELNGSLYFPTHSAKEIAVYSIKNNSFEKVNYKNESRADGSGDFCEAVSYGDYVYFIPRRYPAVVRMDAITGELTYHSDWVEPLKNLTSDVQDELFFYPLTVGSSIMLAACGANAVVEFDMETCKSIVHKVGKPGYGYSGICFDGVNFWLSPRHNTPLVKWNPKTGEVKYFEVMHHSDDIRHSFLPCVFCGGYVWLLPRMADHAIKIDVHTETITAANEFEINDKENVKHQGVKFLFVQVSGTSIFAYSNISKALIEYNCETKRRREEIIKYPLRALKQIEPMVARAFHEFYDAMSSEDFCYYESGSLRLEDLVNYLVLYDDGAEAASMADRRASVARSINSNSEGMSGSAIYEYVREALV